MHGWKRVSALAGGALFALAVATSGAQAQAYRVLWWDSTPDYGGQAATPLRQEMSDYLTTFNGGTLFQSTYVGSETPGTLATHLGSNNYDVIVFDATSFQQKFNAADLSAVQNFYQSNSNILLDGTLYIRSIDYNAFTNFPGPNDALGIFTANEVKSLAVRGGGIMIGTDHDCCQVDANQILDAVIPGAAFSGITYPSTDGEFTGTELLTTAGLVAPADVFNNWSNVPSEAIAPTGNYTDFLGRPVTLYSQVNVADQPGGGTRYPYISTSFAPGGGPVVINDPEPPVTSTPEPATLALFGTGILGLAALRRRRR
jgi:hypothetical protein